MPIHNLKHKELYARYTNYTWDKCKRSVFASRVTRYWYTKEKAIVKTRYDKWDNGTQLRYKIYNSVVDDNGRVCRDCWEYKTWDKFCRSKNTRSWYTPNCYECRNKRKREYRLKTWNAKDREYKLKKRKLIIWEYIALLNPWILNWMIRENSFKVIDYKNRKWYTIQSCLDWHIEKIDTNDNKGSKKFYRIDKPIQLVDNKMPLNSDLKYYWW